MKRFLDRLFRAARLDVTLYDEVAADPKAMFQSMMAVFIYSAASAYGNFGRAGVSGINFGMITTLFGWYVWAFSTYFIAVRLSPGAQTGGDRKSALRALGFATSPGLIRLLALIPDMGSAVFIVASLWMIVASVVAIKRALKFDSTPRAAAACIIGWIISAVFQGLVFIALLSVFGIQGTPF
ncbi:MAG: hypothetical protein HKO68_02080 [Desulfobacterales bacterium]|nr:hypothetical protein [Deltaproteobacteria bacterium]NNL75106.1 hypothetical protein [Desulfobacterales bacterium]